MVNALIRHDDISLITAHTIYRVMLHDIIVTATDMKLHQS